MLKNLSDYLTFFSLILITIYALYFFVLSFTNREKDDVSESRFSLLKDYLNNEEE